MQSPSDSASRLSHVLLRNALVRDIDKASLDRAMELMYTAEGSDRFWWYGSDQDSGDDASFDHLVSRISSCILLFRARACMMWVWLDVDCVFAPSW